MARYIDADELRDEVDSTLNWNTNNEYNMYSDVMDMIDNAPTEDVQPVVHAKWFLDGDSSIEDEKCYRCSNCKAVLEEDYKWHNHNYCYHCGARMDKE